MFEIPDASEGRDNVAVSNHDAAPEADGTAADVTDEDADDTPPEEAGYGYGV